MTAKELRKLCTFAKNTNLQHLPFVTVVLIHASFAAAFCASNMKWLMGQGLLPKATDEDIDNAISMAEDLYCNWLKETYK